MDKIEKNIFSTLVKKIESQLEQANPQLNSQIKSQAEKFQATNPEISSDQAYLLAFAKAYKTNPELQKTLNLTKQDLAIVKAVENKFSYLIKADTFVDVDNNFKQQTEKLANSYNDKLKEAIDIKNLKIENKDILNLLEIDEFKKIAQDNLKVDYNLFEKYLENKTMDLSDEKKKSFEKEKTKILKAYLTKFQTEYFSDYKATAMKIYLDEVF